MTENFQPSCLKKRGYKDISGEGKPRFKQVPYAYCSLRLLFFSGLLPGKGEGIS